jgi:hypothetical protein
MSCRQRRRFVAELLRICDYLDIADLGYVIAELQKMRDAKIEAIRDSQEITPDKEA